jgi:hypothetical protein
VFPLHPNLKHLEKTIHSYNFRIRCVLEQKAPHSDILIAPTKSSTQAIPQSSFKMGLFGKNEEPELKEVFDQRRPSTVEAMANQHRKSVSNRGLTGASALTVRQSIYPITLVTILFFLWGKSLLIQIHYPHPNLPPAKQNFAIKYIIQLLIKSKQDLPMAFWTSSMPSSKPPSTSQLPRRVDCKEHTLAHTSLDR